MEFCHRKLANGLEVVAEVNPQAYSTALAFFVRTGARDESDEIAGVSHFLEHMVFKGTPSRSAEDVNRELDEIGSHSNAFTSEEQTVYYATFLPEYLERALELLADIMRPSLREDDFNTEKQVIIEEIYKYEDQPPFGAHEKCMALYFDCHPLGRSVLGTVQTVGGLTPGAMRAYFERRYSPGNIVLVATGRVDFAQLLALAEKHCGAWQPYQTGRTAEPSAPRSAFRLIPKENAQQEYLVQVSGGPAAEDENRYASRVLATVLGDDSGSRLFWALVDTGLAEYAGIGAYEFQGTGILMTGICCAPEDTADNLERLLDIQRQAEKLGITEEELEQAKSKICSHVVLQGERASNRLFSVGNGWVQRRHYRSVKETVQAYQKVTLRDLTDALKRYPLTVNATVAVGPLTELSAAK